MGSLSETAMITATTLLAGILLAVISSTNGTRVITKDDNYRSLSLEAPVIFVQPPSENKQGPTLGYNRTIPGEVQTGKFYRVGKKIYRLKFVPKSEIDLNRVKELKGSAAIQLQSIQSNGYRGPIRHLNGFEEDTENVGDDHSFSRQSEFEFQQEHQFGSENPEGQSKTFFRSSERNFDNGIRNDKFHSFEQNNDEEPTIVNFDSGNDNRNPPEFQGRGNFEFGHQDSQRQFEGNFHQGIGLGFNENFGNQNFGENEEHNDFHDQENDHQNFQSEGNNFNNEKFGGFEHNEERNHHQELFNNEQNINFQPNFDNDNFKPASIHNANNQHFDNGGQNFENDHQNVGINEHTKPNFEPASIHNANNQHFGNIGQNFQQHENDHQNFGINEHTNLPEHINQAFINPVDNTFRNNDNSNQVRDIGVLPILTFEKREPQSFRNEANFQRQQVNIINEPINLPQPHNNFQRHNFNIPAPVEIPRTPIEAPFGIDRVPRPAIGDSIESITGPSRGVSVTNGIHNFDEQYFDVPASIGNPRTTFDVTLKSNPAITRNEAPFAPIKSISVPSTNTNFQQGTFSVNQGRQNSDGQFLVEQNDYSAIPGVPGVDYQILETVPLTNFDCGAQQYAGYYADLESRCQTFHICGFDNSVPYTFLCPVGTLFDQRYFICNWWYNVDCDASESYYALNENLYVEETSQSHVGSESKSTEEIVGKV